MKPSHAKKAIQKYRQAGGNFSTCSSIPLKKEADLASYYYPGINGVLEKMGKKEANRLKMCSLPKTVGVLSTKGEPFYSVISARAALISQVTDCNAVPLLLRYDKVKNIGKLLGQLSINFQAMICSDFSPLERSLALSRYKGKVPLLFHEQLEAAAVVAALMASSKMLKKPTKKLMVTIEGSDILAHDIVELIAAENCGTITLLDERGPLYRKRPNMNKDKKMLVDLAGAKKKDERTRSEVLAETDVYISTLHQNITESLSSKLPEKAVLISLKAESVTKQKKQTLVSTLPDQPNHITDVHIAAGIVTALCEGKKWSEGILSQAIKGFATVYKTPKSARLLPGLLEKNMAKKIAKSIK